MPTYRRLIAHLHHIEADTPQDADRIARARADWADTFLRGFEGASAWAPTVTDPDCEDGGLMDILRDAYQRDDDPDGQGWIPLDETVVPERLIAWRDAAVKAALESR